jgi:branched-subunit amino acid transport protein AzlD
VIFKLLIVILLFIVIFSLGQALFYLIKDEGKSDRMVKALSWRIGLSVFIFLLLLIGQAVGLIQSHGLS